MKEKLLIILLVQLLRVEASDGLHRSKRDASDENQPLAFECENKNESIPYDWVCDGYQNCDDNSDEIGCNEERCGSMSKLKCKYRDVCIYKFWFCDGHNDCGDNSDETDCSEKRCNEAGKFGCKNKNKCISQNRVCDGADDCGDN
ncbi:hypothetical protein TSAR_014277 [Trichomalopsis sarcophagae]|uniref:Uncharacterized protein n=1 Tax=Trichomalopsis sarcophagae TaxID=543379 RepID=A0A232FLR0_9HYME|nr:hypothetical protein TSAR_014277 [Trichomalopsis sarcophagae]